MQKKSTDSLVISKKNSETSLTKKESKDEVALTPADKINLIGKNDALTQSQDASNSGGTQSPL